MIPCSIMRPQCVNSLWPSDVIWRQRSRSTLALVMACCLMTPSHCLNQCWLMISEVLWHSPDSNFTENTSDIYRWTEFEIYSFETVVKSPRSQWVKWATAIAGWTMTLFGHASWPMQLECNFPYWYGRIYHVTFRWFHFFFNILVSCIQTKSWSHITLCVLCVIAVIRAEQFHFRPADYLSLPFDLNFMNHFYIDIRACCIIYMCSLYHSVHKSTINNQNLYNIGLKFISWKYRFDHLLGH